MTKPYLRTSDIARAAGVHPNTVRMYEEWGYLPPVKRGRNNYRLFTEAHLDQMLLARKALQWPYPGGKGPIIELVKSAANSNFGKAMELAYHYLANVRAEKTHAESAVTYLEHWANGQIVDTIEQPVRIGEAADMLGVTRDMLRNWDRNSLLEVPRNPHSGYREYGPEELGRARVIRMLRQSGYSVMAILRMMLAYDSGQTANLRGKLDIPLSDEDTLNNVADRWLATLEAEEQRALDVIQYLVAMIARSQA